MTEGESETDETRATGRAARVTKGGQKAGKPIVSSGRRAPQTRQPQTALNNRLLWRIAAAQHGRSRAETAPRNMFRPVAETLAFNPDPGFVGGDGIGSTLRAITAATQMGLDAERGGIMADFANRIAAAKATARPQDLPGILRAIKEQRLTALATAARNASREKSEQRQAVLQGGQAQRPKPSGRRKPHKPKSDLSADAA
jgi:hypothetical protein